MDRLPIKQNHHPRNTHGARALKFELKGGIKQVRRQDRTTSIPMDETKNKCNDSSARRDGTKEGSCVRAVTQQTQPDKQ